MNKNRLRLYDRKPSADMSNDERRIPLLKAGDLKSKLDYLKKLMLRDFTIWIKTCFSVSNCAFAIMVDADTETVNYSSGYLLVVEPKCTIHSGEDVLAQDMSDASFFIVNYVSSKFWVDTSIRHRMIDYKNSVLLGKIVGIQQAS